MLNEKLSRIAISAHVSGTLLEIFKNAFGSDEENYPFASKRLRGVLILRIGKENGLRTEALLEIASAIELIHISTLVIDDIQDHDEFRDGRSSIWKMYGVETAITFGYIMANLGFSHYLNGVRKLNLNAKGETTAIQMLTSMIARMCTGQKKDIELKTEAKNKKEYLKMAEDKTGAFLGFALALSAVLSGIDDIIVVEKLQLIGQNFGVIHQINDDEDDHADLRNSNLARNYSLIKDIEKRWGYIDESIRYLKCSEFEIDSLNEFLHLFKDEKPRPVATC